MADIVVTVPINFRLPEFPGLRGLDAWCAEGDAAGEEDSGELWCFATGGSRPDIVPGERVYILCEDRIRGYAPLVRLGYNNGEIRLIRGGGAVAVTIPQLIPGFQGWRRRWWERTEEVPFLDWKTRDRRYKPRARAVEAARQGRLF